jgi:tetratricopeptide (TPR) repeat protein
VIQYPLYARKAVVDPLFSTRMQLDYVHNEYLQLTAELGFVGLGLAVWLALSMVRSVSRAARGGLTSTLPHVSMALAAALAGALVDASFSFPFRRALPPLLIMVILGLLTTLSRDAVGEPGGVSERSLDPPRWLSLSAGVAGLVALVGMTWIQYHWIQGDRHCRRMLQAEARADWPTVVAQGKAAHRHNPHLKEPLFAMGNAFLARGEAGQAAGVLERLLESNPNDLNALANLGLAHSGLGDSGKALDCYRRAVALEPEEALLHYRMGSLLEARGDADAALAAYRLAARYEPRNGSYQYHLGIAALRRGSHAEAAKALETSLALDPRSAGAHKALGVLLVGAGRTGEGVEHFRKALALDERIADALRMRKIVESYDKERGGGSR